MRLLACVALSAFVLTGCGRGFYPAPPDAALPQVTLQTPVQNLISFNDAVPLALYKTSPVVPLFAVPNINTNIAELDLVFWGTKDASGNITQLTEAGISGLSSNVHIFFDTSQRPVYFREDGSGYGMILSYDSATHQTLTVCDPSNAAIASVPILISNGAATAGQPVDGGSCTLGRAAAIARKTQFGAATNPNAAGVSTNLSDIASLVKLMTADSYVAGFAFAVGAILKFKAHKDNPTQQSLSVPIVLLFVAAALIFLPSVFRASGATLFESLGSAQVDGALPSFLAESQLPGCSSSSAACPFPSPEPTP